MRRKTQRLAASGDELRHRVAVTSVSLRGPTIDIAPPTKKVLDPLLIELKNRNVLYEDYSLEVGHAVAASLFEMREKLVEAQKQIVIDSRARGLLERMADACVAFLRRHPELNPREWSQVRITQDTVDDLYALRQSFASALLEMWDEWGLASAQELLNRIKLEPPDLSGLMDLPPAPGS